jgi:hypothetical protein
MNNRINLSLNEDTLARLIQEGHVCAADLGFLDTFSKRKVWQLCLRSCKSRCLNAKAFCSAERCEEKT